MSDIQRFNDQHEPDPDGGYVLYVEHEAMVKSLLEREAATHARHDQRLSDLEEAAARGLTNSNIADYLSAVPTAPRILRLPIIRHIRATIQAARVEHHYRSWYNATGALPIHKHLDDHVVLAIWRGEK